MRNLITLFGISLITAGCLDGSATAKAGAMQANEALYEQKAPTRVKVNVVKGGTWTSKQ